MPNQEEFDSGANKANAIGWATYDGSAYTSVSPLTIASTKTQITIDGLGGSTNTDDLPDGVSDYWNPATNRIIPTAVGDAFDVRVGFKAKSSAVNAYFDITFDIGTPDGIVIAGETKMCPKGAGVETQYSVDIPIYALATFLANGCAIHFDTTASAFTLSVYDITIFLKQDYKRY